MDKIRGICGLLLSEWSHWDNRRAVSLVALGSFPARVVCSSTWAVLKAKTGAGPRAHCLRCGCFERRALPAARADPGCPSAVPGSETTSVSHVGILSCQEVTAGKKALPLGCNKHRQLQLLHLFQRHLLWQSTERARWGQSLLLHELPVEAQLLTESSGTAWRGQENLS